MKHLTVFAVDLVVVPLVVCAMLALVVCLAFVGTVVYLIDVFHEPL